MRIDVRPALLLASLLLVAACENIPLYNESLDWFSWSEYDPEVKAIVNEIPPPGGLEVPPATGEQVSMAPSTTGATAAGGAGAAQVGTTGTESGTSVSSDVAASSTAATTSVATPSGTATSSAGTPPVGIRNSVAGSVTWRSPRGTP